MNFEEFKQQLMEDLKKYLPTEVGSGVEIAENAVEKLQHESYDGITVKREDSQIGINMDAGKLYADLEQGKTYDDVFHYAVDIVQRGFDDVPKVDIAKFLDYEAMKETLTMQVIPISGNEEMLHNIPHKEVEDLAIVYRFSVAQEDSGIATILIKNDLLERYGITAEQLHTDACEFAPIREQVSIKNMTEVLAEMMGPEFGDMLNEMPMGDGPAMYVATNDSKVNGASVMMYPGFMEEAAEKTGGNFFVLPSSTHEILLIPEKDVDSYLMLQEMVQEVNMTQVSPEEKLSDNVYHYDVKDKVFELAEFYEDRMKDKENSLDEKDSVLADLKGKQKEISEKEPAKNAVEKATKSKGGEAI